MKKFGVIFDMDGVIVDSNPYHKIALKEFCSAHGYELTDDQLIKKIYGRTNREWITALFGKIPDDQLAEYAEEKESLFRKLFDQDIKPVKGLIKFLDLLDEHKIVRAIGTSAPKSNVDFSLERTHTEKYFPTILNDTFVTHSKPHPEIYLKCAEALNLPNSQCIVIEDSLSGVEAGQKAGSKVIGITTTHTREELSHCALVIEDFEGLTIEMLEKLV
ncbi:MAG TPA: HAD family phosphatase [Cyclobacteriaceae bacterium]|nr:HAD family phosphatase [Cyclobacteriaceae bacterium]